MDKKLIRIALASAMLRSPFIFNFNKSGNNYTPCDKCGKPTRGVRCHKCSTQGQ